jgi:hypothetical protein
MEQVAHAVGIIQAGSMRFEGTVDSLRAEVRRVAGPVQPADVPWLEQVRGDACRASPEAWQANGLAADALVDDLDLEAIFLAFARTDAVDGA